MLTEIIQDDTIQNMNELKNMYRSMMHKPQQLLNKATFLLTAIGVLYTTQIQASLLATPSSTQEHILYVALDDDGKINDKYHIKNDSLYLQRDGKGESKLISNIAAHIKNSTVMTGELSKIESLTQDGTWIEVGFKIEENGVQHEQTFTISYNTKVH